MQTSELLASLRLDSGRQSGVYAGRWIDDPDAADIESRSPIDGTVLGRVTLAGIDDYEAAVVASQSAFTEWRQRPAPARGEIVRRIGHALRAKKEELGRLVTLEMGKSISEGRGEVQEMIDMADLCVGMSRQMYGKTMHSERPGHRMYEQWHPLGPIGIITAFNFPVAVWAWNALVAAICGDSMIWKPSPKTPLTAVAIQHLVNEILEPEDLAGLMNLVVADVDPVGETMIADRRLPLISATGSCRMGKRVGEVVGARLGRSLLELGGNGAIIVMDDADLELATRGIAFGAAGTAGQRCTTTRRVLMQRGIAADLTARLERAYASLPIGDPLDEANLIGPLIDQDAVQMMQNALAKIRAEGGEVLFGGDVLEGPGYESGCWVRPCLVRATPEMAMVREETFAPILYLIEIDDLDAAIASQNDVPQGLSSAIFTTDVRSAERFLAATGSDCGIANVNIGTSGAEIGGAFGGEKETGGGREAGSDAWKAYMRRQTCTINWSTELPLAQGVSFA